jgi:hypothetical protein
VKKSSAGIPCACDRRNSGQPGPSWRGAGSIPALLRICHTVDGAYRDAEPGLLAMNAVTRSAGPAAARPTVYCALAGARSDRGATGAPSGGEGCPDASARWCRA